MFFYNSENSIRELRYKAILSSIVLSQYCCELYFILFALPHITEIATLTLLAGSTFLGVKNLRLGKLQLVKTSDLNRLQPRTEKEFFGLLV